MIKQLKTYFNELTGFNASKSLYAQTTLNAWLIYCLVYSFMIFQFCWGHHDWWYIKDRMFISDGFFEGRYNQHLISVLLFDGQILPVMVYLTTFALLAVFSLLLAIYLEIPPKPGKWLFFSLFIGFNPHIFVLFSYVYLMLPLVFWGTISICFLFFINPPYHKINIFGAIISSLLILGSYPPIIGLVCTLFCAKQLLKFHQQNNIKQIIINTGIFCLILGTAFLVYKLAMIPIIAGTDYNAEMYNTKTIPIAELIKRIERESLRSITQLWQKYPFLDGGYYQILSLILIIAVGITLYDSNHKKITCLLLIALFIASRVAFIIAENADFAAFRISYWGKLGLFAYAISILLRHKAVKIRNFTFIAGGLCLFLFIQTDFEIQKIWNLGFKAERLSHTRLLERITQNPSYNQQNKYVFLNFGRQYYKARYYTGKTFMEDNEMLSFLSLPADLGEILFWEEKDNPVIVKLGIWENKLWRVHNQRFYTSSSPHFTITPETISQLRYWMYMDSDVYPNDKSIYIKDNYIFVAIDKIAFNKNKELVLNNIEAQMDKK